MEDGYKELIEKLHNIESAGDAPIGKRWSVLIDKSTLRDVIDVIERLVRERDTAVKDLHGYCWCCTKVKQSCFPTNDEDCKDWEWRGVQE